MLDHLVLAAPNLDDAVDYVHSLTGVRPSPGGAHPKWGTRNALMEIGEEAYIEVIGPDPEQPEFSGTRPFHIDELDAPKLVTWAIKAPNIDEVVARAKENGYDPGPIFDGKRALPDGSLLEWRLTMAQLSNMDGLIPFLIDWGTSPHPAHTATPGCQLTSLKIQHPDSEEINGIYSALNLNQTVTQADIPKIVATLVTPSGNVTIE